MVAIIVSIPLIKSRKTRVTGSSTAVHYTVNYTFTTIINQEYLILYQELNTISHINSG